MKCFTDEFICASKFAYFFKKKSRREFNDPRWRNSHYIKGNVLFISFYSGKVVTENIGDAFQYKYTLAAGLNPNSYVVTIDLQVCYLAGEFCKTYKLLDAANLKCSSMRRKKRRRRSITEYVIYTV